MRFASRTLVTSVFALAAACGGDSSSGPDASTAPDAATGFQTAPHTPLPQAIPHGGKIIAHPQLVTITFDGTDDPNVATETGFGDAIVASDWLKTVGKDFGVDNVGTSNTNVSIGPAPASIDFNGIVALVQNKITDGTLPAPTQGGDSHIYMVYFPRKVTLDANSLGGECGHHGAAVAKGVTIAYAAILDRDPNVANCGGLPGITTTASHELIEAATDPYDPPNDGYYVDPPLPDPWWLIAGEVGDLCDGEATIQSGGYSVQRIWSNSAAAAGRAPCVPFDPDDKWNSVTTDPKTMPTISAGGSVTFTLTGWSTDPMADWSLETFTADYSDLLKSEINPSFSGGTTINNGKTVMLTLHAPANAQSGSVGGLYILSGDAFRPQPVGFIVQ